MTPHDGESRHIFYATGDKSTRTRVAAPPTASIVVPKGTETVIAIPGGRTIVNGHAPATLGTAGSGGVLAEIVFGLLAQHMDPFLAAAPAVWLHGAAATVFRPRLIAKDLPDLLPGVFPKLFASVPPKQAQAPHCQLRK
jgi:NAD(P)H-hydrate epimerase